MAATFTIRAAAPRPAVTWDAWDETKHKRAKNGQFGSGSGSPRPKKEADDKDGRVHVVTRSTRLANGGTRTSVHGVFASEAEAKKAHAKIVAKHGENTAQLSSHDYAGDHRHLSIQTKKVRGKGGVSVRKVVGVHHVHGELHGKTPGARTSRHSVKGRVTTAEKLGYGSRTIAEPKAGVPAPVKAEIKKMVAGPKNSYEQKQDARRDRLQAASERTRAEAERHIQKAHGMAEAIPFGQPTRGGSDSAGRRDLNYRDGVHKHLKAGVAGLKEADRLATKAAGVGKGGISNKDPEALSKLKDQLSNQERNHAKALALNRFIKAGDKKGAADYGFTEKEIDAFFKPDHMGRVRPAPTGHITSAIAATKKRIEELGGSVGAGIPEAVKAEIATAVATQSKPTVEDVRSRRQAEMAAKAKDLRQRAAKLEAQSAAGHAALPADRAYSTPNSGIGALGRSQERSFNAWGRSAKAGLEAQRLNKEAASLENRTARVKGDAASEVAKKAAAFHAEPGDHVMTPVGMRQVHKVNEKSVVVHGQGGPGSGKFTFQKHLVTSSRKA